MATSRIHRDQARPAFRCGLLLGGILLITPGLAQLQKPGPPGVVSDQYKISVDVKLVVLPVTATDSKGGTISDLHAQDFRVYEDGHLQKLVLFKHEDVPVTLALVVDNSSSMLPKRQSVIEAVLAFARSSNPHDQMFVVNFSDTPSLGLPDKVPFTDQPALLSRCLGTTSGGHTALYDAIALALEHLKQGTRPKKALIVVSDGGDNASHHRLSEVLHMAESSNALIYTVGLLDVHEMDQNPGVLRRLAKATGGESYFPDSLAGVEAVFLVVAHDLREHYTLGYVPPNPDNTNRYRRIRVQVVAPGKGKVRVRTRDGYYIPPPAEPAKLSLKVVKFKCTLSPSDFVPSVTTGRERRRLPLRILAGRPTNYRKQLGCYPHRCRDAPHPALRANPSPPIEGDGRNFGLISPLRRRERGRGYFET